MAVMPFGVHRGRDVRALPQPYLEWIAGQPWLYPWLQAALAEELEIRRWARILAEAQARAQSKGNNGGEWR